MLLPSVLSYVLQDREPGSMTARKPRPFISPRSKEYKNFHVSIAELELFKDPTAPQVSPDKQTFLAAVQEANNNSGKKELVLFIHGYNVSFADALKSAAQLTFDTSQDYLQSHTLLDQRVALAFDWASCHALSSYGFVPWNHDRERAERAAPKLAELLSDLANHVSDSLNSRQSSGTITTKAP